MLNTFLTALILTAAIPTFGLLIEFINYILIKIISRFLGVSIALFIANRLTFIGVVCHELSHALFAFITGAKIYEIAIFKPDGNSLGHVTYAARGTFISRAIQHTFSSVAPVVCGAALSCLIIYFLRTHSFLWWQLILIYYILISIIMHMKMSKADIKSMWKGLPVVFILVLIIVWLTKFNLIP